MQAVTNKTSKRLSTRLTLAATIITLSSVMIEANELRNGTWEIFLTPQFTDQTTFSFGNGSQADISSRSALGLGIGYNVNPNVELAILMNSSSGNYEGTRVHDDGTSEKFTSNMYTSSIKFAATYNFLEGDFTPFVSASIGSTYIDSGISTGEEITGCYWYPWYGYLCGPVDLTYTTVSLNYGASIGLRYDLNDQIFIKGSIGKDYLDIDSSNTADLTVYQFSIGAAF